jgi:hypothetical protein
VSDELRIRALEARVAELEAFMTNVKRAVSGERELEVAKASDLDSQYGDEEIRINVRDAPRQYKGYRMSETTPEYLDRMAEVLEWMATKNDEAGKMVKNVPASKYDRRSAARARGWAARLRAGWKPKERARPAFNPDAAPAAPSRPAWMDAAPVDDDMKFPLDD